jgi:energy-coupling factor transporter ATP-binding protein EcfA2
VVVVTGQAGSGKSTLAAALARPELTAGLAPEGYAHAVAMLGPTTNTDPEKIMPSPSRNRRCRCS